MIKLLIFDLDGTLIDSAPDIIATTQSLLEKNGLPPVAPEAVVAAIGEGLKKFVFSLFPDARNNPTFLEEVERQFYSAYSENLLQHTTVFPGVEDFLRQSPLQKAIVTNKYSDLTQQTLQGLGLLKHPWLRVFGADSLAQRKPDPLPLLEVMRIAGVDRHETVMIGDGIPDMVAARRAGIHSIGVTFGYTSIERLKAEGASLLLHSYADLPEVLAEIETFSPREVLSS